MTSLIFDTDVLSTFGKIRKLDLLRKLLPDAVFFFPLSICKHGGHILVTNDAAAKKVCDFYGIKFIDLSVILTSLLAEKILTNEEVKLLINEIEQKDRVIIRDKDDILTENSDKE